MLTLAAELLQGWNVVLAATGGGAGDRLLQRARELGVETLCLHGDAAPELLEEWLQNRRVELFHAHAGVAWEGHAGVLAARRAGVPAVVRTEHLPNVITTTGQRAAHRALARQVDRMICVSHAAARSYLDAGIPPGEVRVVLNGIRALEALPERVNLPAEAPVVLSVGRLAAQKGFELLVDAAVELPEASVLIVGEGPLADDLRRRITERGLGERVWLLGQREDVPSLMAGADVLAMPSRFEGLPLVALEAMSLGLVVVGTRVPGLTEVVVDGVTGRLVPPGDAHALARALAEVLGSPERSAAWGRAGQARQREEFGAGRMGRETAAVYDEVLAECRARPRPSGGEMERTRIGVVGAGVIASRHLGNLLEFPDVDVVAVADPSFERACGLAARCGAKAYVDHTMMLARERLDALYICVPPFAHGAPELAALEAGLPFFVEKPLAVDLETAEAIAEALAGSDLPTAVGYHWRYLDVYEEARALLKERPARLALGYWLDATPPPGWWVQGDLSGGQTIEQTTHVLDLARTLVGEVTAVYAAGSRTERETFPDADVDDVSTATLHFESGAVGSISSTCLLRWPHRIGLHTISDGMVIELAEFEIMVDVGEGRPVSAAQVDPFVAEDRDFVDAVRGSENRVRVPYDEALGTHRLACAVARSASEGRLVELTSDAARA